MGAKESISKSISLIWIDKLVNNNENKDYQENMKQIIMDCVFIDYFVPSESQRVFDSKKQQIIIAGPSFAYEIVKCTNKKIIVFCQNETSHINLFLDNPQIITLVNSEISEVEQLIQQQQKFIIEQRQLESQFGQQRYYIQNDQMKDKLKKSYQIISQFLQHRLNYLIQILQLPKDIVQQGRIKNITQKLKKEIDQYFDDVVALSSNINQGQYLNVLNSEIQLQNVAITSNFLIELLPFLQQITNLLIEEQFIYDFDKIHKFQKKIHQVCSNFNCLYWNQLEIEFFKINDNEEYVQLIEKFTYSNPVEAIQMLQKSVHDNSHLVMSFGPSVNQEFISQINRKKIVFCKNELSRIQLFLDNSEITTLVSNERSAVEHINNYIDAVKIQQRLHSQFKQQPFSKCTYQHTTESVSFNFLLVHERLKKQYSATYNHSKDLYIELKSLLHQNVYEQILKEKKKERKLFENLIYFYTIESNIRGKSFYNKLNELMSMCEYEQIQTILVVLFKGYQELQNKKEFRTLNRGISFETRQQYNEAISQFNMNQQSYFWSTLVSTSFDEKVALGFAKTKKFGIFFEIELDQENPHPYYEIINSDNDYEKEILLFPQFQFKILFQQELSNENITILKIKVKQQAIDYSTVFDNVKREWYWSNKIKDMRKSFEITFEFMRDRINYLIKIVQKDEYPQNQKQYIAKKFKEEIDAYTDSTIQYLKQQGQKIGILDECNLILKNTIQINRVTSEFLNELSGELREITNTLLDEFIKLLQNYFYIGQFRDKIAERWKKFMDKTNINIKKVSNDDFWGKALKEIIFQVQFSATNKAVIENGQLKQIGVNPKIIIFNIQKENNSIILLMVTKNRICWIATKRIQESQWIIEEDDQEYGQNYVGPSSEEVYFQIYLIGVSDLSIDVATVIENLNNDRLTLVSYSSQWIENKP